MRDTCLSLSHGSLCWVVILLPLRCDLTTLSSHHLCMRVLVCICMYAFMYA
jgi:hypothetical protein